MLLLVDLFPHAVNFELVASSLIFHFLELKRSRVDVFPKRITVVRFVLDVSLELENLSLPPCDLVSQRCNLHLHVVVSSALIIKMEPGIVTLLLESVQRNAVRVVPSFELVVLHEFFILKVSELGLDRVKLVSEREVVFVSLLNLENLSF